MSAIDVFNEIIDREVQAVMLHDELACVMDFMGFRGEKRWQEYRLLSEFCDMRKTERYMVNIMSRLPSDNSIKRPVEVIPASWRNATRFDVSDGDRRSRFVDCYKKWHAWETETKAFLQEKYDELVREKHYACAEYVQDMLDCVSCELKYLERKYIEYSAVNWDMAYIFDKQEEMHDHYKEKLEKVLRW